MNAVPLRVRRELEDLDTRSLNCSSEWSVVANCFPPAEHCVCCTQSLGLEDISGNMVHLD
jgi:hypothetical protein